MCGQGKDQNSGKGDKPKIIFVVGGPGSGKGTQCEKLVEKYKFEHLSTGDLLREEVASGSENGVALQKIMSEGGLVPTTSLLGLLKAAMQKKGWAKCNPGFLIDGFPRNKENVTCFGENLASETTLLCTLFFDVDAETMKGRCLGRGQGRADDNEATIQKRLNTYLNETVQIITEMKENGNVKTLDASESKEAVTEKTFVVMDELLGIKKDTKKEAPKAEAKVEEKVEEVAVVEEKKEEVAVVEEKVADAPVEEVKEETPVEEVAVVEEVAPVEEVKEETPAE